MPSTCFLSAASIASENSLPNAPKSDTAIASTPANGPSPTTLIQTSAQITVSTPRIESTDRQREHRSYRGAKQRDRRGFAKRDQIGRQRGAGIGRDHHQRDPAKLVET